MAKTAELRKTAQIIGKNLRLLRKQRFPGWGGQRRFADFLDLSPNDLCVYEYGRSAPNEARLEEMTRRLGLADGELQKPLPGSEEMAREPGADDGDSGNLPAQVDELRRTVARLEGRLEAYGEMERKQDERIRQLQEANFLLRSLLYAGDTPEARARRDKVLERLGPSMGEMVKLHGAF